MCLIGGAAYVRWVGIDPSGIATLNASPTIRPGNEPHARSITMSGIFEHLPFIADPLDVPELFKLVEKGQDILLT